MTTIPGAVRVLVAPNGLPCTDDPLDPGYSSALQISLRNDTGAALDLSGAHLAITFAVDPGGSGSSGALLLSPASAPGATTHPISAAVAAGTDWDVEPSPGTPGRFSAYPNGSGLLAPATTLTFLFTGIVVDLTPGATEITVDVVGIDGLTVIAAPPIAKTPASSGITQFSASPMLVLRDGSTQIQFATIGGAQAPIISWDEPSCLVVDEQGNAQLSPWTTPAASGSFTAFPDVATEFVLDMQSPGIDLGRLTVSVATPYLQLRPATIAPVEPTEFVPLSWMVLNVPDSSATLSWDEPADVHTMAGGNLTSPAVVSLIGQALVSTTTDIRFTPADTVRRDGRRLRDLRHPGHVVGPDVQSGPGRSGQCRRSIGHRLLGCRPRHRVHAADAQRERVPAAVHDVRDVELSDRAHRFRVGRLHRSAGHGHRSRVPRSVRLDHRPTRTSRPGALLVRRRQPL